MTLLIPFYNEVNKVINLHFLYLPFSIHILAEARVIDFSILLIILRISCYFFVFRIAAGSIDGRVSIITTDLRDNNEVQVRYKFTIPLCVQ